MFDIQKIKDNTVLTLVGKGSDGEGSETRHQRPYIRETMHSALNLSCTIRAQLISATRGRASQPKVLAMATDCSATCQQG